MTPVFRKINANDQALFLAMSDEFYHSPAVLHDIDASFHQRTFDELMRSDEYADCYIIEADGAAAGYALLAKTFSREAGGIVIWIEELYLRSAYQGQGLGSSFFHWIEQQLPAARYRLEVEPENVRAARLYERLGYSVLPYRQMIKE